jgi:RND family efflux transporter MFP subunit
MDGSRRSPWRQRLLWSLLGFLVAAAVFLTLELKRTSRAADRSPAAPSAAPVAVAAADPAPAPEAECYLGVVLASEAVEVVAEIEGRVEELPVRVGDRVERGELLARLDTRRLRHQLTIERADLATARAQRDRIALEAERAEQEHQRRLALEGLLSQEESESSKFDRDRARLELQVADAELARVEARIEQLETDLERSELRAPFDGVVALRYLDPGAVATPGTPVVRLIGARAQMVRFAVPPESAEEVAIDLPVRIEVEDLGFARTGTVEHIAPEIDTASQMVFVEARLDPAATPEPIPSGAVARVAPVPSGRPAPSSCLGR